MSALSDLERPTPLRGWDDSWSCPDPRLCVRCGDESGATLFGTLTLDNRSACLCDGDNNDCCLHEQWLAASLCSRDHRYLPLAGDGSTEEDGHRPAKTAIVDARKEKKKKKKQQSSSDSSSSSDNDSSSSSDSSSSDSSGSSSSSSDSGSSESDSSESSSESDSSSDTSEEVSREPTVVVTKQDPVVPYSVSSKVVASSSKQDTLIDWEKDEEEGPPLSPPRALYSTVVKVCKKEPETQGSDDATRNRRHR